MDFEHIGLHKVYIQEGFLSKYKGINRGYSMLFDEYEIYFTSETGFLIFS
jgi:hypothetical protein